MTQTVQWTRVVYGLLLASNWSVSNEIRKSGNTPQVNFSGLDWRKWAAGVSAPSPLSWEMAPGVVHPALCGSHGNKTLQPQEVRHTGILGSWPVRSDSHSGVVYEEAGEKGNTHTHRDRRRHTRDRSNSQNPSVQLPMLHYCHATLGSRAAFLPGSHLGVLPGLNWYSQGPAGWRGPKLAGGGQGFKGCN